jgi:hypothetical protein
MGNSGSIGGVKDMHTPRGQDYFKDDKMTRIFGQSYMTDGVSELAETNDAHWLVTDIAAYATDIDEAYQFWSLKVVNGVGELRCVPDKGEDPVYELDWIVTDYPEGEVRLWVVKAGEHTTIMLPSEY